MYDNDNMLRFTGLHVRGAPLWSALDRVLSLLAPSRLLIMERSEAQKPSNYEINVHHKTLRTLQAKKCVGGRGEPLDIHLTYTYNFSQSGYPGVQNIFSFL